MRENDQERPRVSDVEPRLLSAACRTRSRLRGLEGVRSLGRDLPWALLFLTPGALAYRLEYLSFSALLWSSALALSFVGWRMVRAVSRGPSLLAATLRLDDEHCLEGRLAAALSFSGSLETSSSRETVSGYELLVIEEARHLPALSPQNAVPAEVPAGIFWGGAMLSFLGLLTFLPFAPKLERVLEEPALVQSSLTSWIDQDDAELLERAASKLQKLLESDEGQEAATRFNEIVLKVAAGEISRAEAFRLAAELQADIQTDAARAELLKDGLRSRGETLQQRSITRKIGEALLEGRYQDAEEALRKLSERLASKSQALSRKELKELRESMEALRKQGQEATEESPEQQAAKEREHQSLSKKRKSLLKKKQEGTASQEELNELAKTERELKRLSRQRKEASIEKTLSDLDKELAQAAKSLQKEAKKSGRFMDQAADTLKEGTSRQLSDDEKRALLKEIKAMKERLRRQRKDGKQAARLREFQKRARGAQGQKEGQPKPGGKKAPGEGKSPGQVRLGPGGAPIPGAGQEEGPAERGATGQKAGTSHDPSLSGEESRLAKAKNQDVSAVAQDSGEGQSASETILSVAEEGFQSGSYDKLFRQYQTVAEEVMEKERVPAGRRAHIERYFELIRPRGQRPLDKEEK